MIKENWIFMPHAGHFICGDKCRFHLNTYVGKYIVSTVGELWLERGSREIHAQVYDPKWLVENKHLKGDEFDNAYFKRFGFEQLGAGKESLYETMVFKARKSKNKCCPYEIIVEECVDSKRYGKNEEAVKGHMKLCLKWSKHL